MSKKLLCVLVVLALALCVFPMVGLPATQANAASDVNNSLSFKADGKTAYCPHCKEEVEWTELADCQGADKMYIGDMTDAGKQHIYLAENRTQLLDGEFVLLSGKAQLCLHLNGHNLTTRGRMTVGYTPELAIMGNGTVTFLANCTNTSYNAMAVNCLGIATIYGGIWKNAEGVTALGAQVAWGTGSPALNITGDAHFVSEVECTKDIDAVTLDRDATVNHLDMQAKSKLTIAGTWTGRATVSLAAQPDAEGCYTADRVKVTGAFTGTLIRTDGVRLSPKGNTVRAVNATTKDNLADVTPGDGVMNDVCPVCGKSKEWVDLSRLTASPNPAAGHYYLSDDLTAIGSNWAANLLTLGESSLCLHLNGRALTTASRVYAGTNCTVNVIAGNGGRVIYTGAHSGAKAFLTPNNGVINVYGGTYTFTPKDETVADKGIAYLGGSLNLYDAALNGKLDMNSSASYTKARATLYGTASVNGVADFSNTGSLVLEEGWSGKITEYRPCSDVVNARSGVISVNRINATGTYKGTIGNLVWKGSVFVCKAVIVKGTAAVPYASAAAAAAAYTQTDFAEGNIIRLFADGSVALSSGKNYYIDARGNDVAVSGAGTLYPMDSANDTYDATVCGKWTVAAGVTVKNDVTNGNRYIILKTGKTYTAHRLEMKLTRITLRTGDAGVCFEAEYRCDDTLAKRVTRYGVAVSKSAIPNAVGKTGDGYSQINIGFTPDVISHRVNGNIGTVVGIFKDDATLNNKERAKTTIHTRVYFSVKTDDATGTATDFLSAEGGSYSLYDVLSAIDSGWGKYNEEQRTAAQSFYNAWKGKGASGCRVENLGLTKIPKTSDLTYTLKVGYAYFDMTPDKKILSNLILGGRGTSNNTPSGTILDKLPGTCVAFADESGETALMYTLDLLGAYQDIMAFVPEIAAKTGIPESNIFINTTHSHSAPQPAARYYTTDKAKAAYTAYMTYLKTQMITAGNAAKADLAPAQMYTASVKVPNMNSVRHYLTSDGTIAGDGYGNTSATVVKPVEDADNTLQLIKFTRTGGKQDVLLMNWQGHPNRRIDGKSNLHILSGLEQMRAELETEHDTLLAFFLGASGNVNNSSRVSETSEWYNQYNIPTKDDYDEHYAALLKKIVAVLDSNSFTKQPMGKLQVLKKTVSLVAANKASLRDMSIYGFSMGDVAFVMAPYEMFNASGLFIKENSPYAMTFVSTCAMGANSYIPTDEVYDFKVKEGTGYGDNHPIYEANGCQFARGSAEILAKEYVTLLCQMKAG